MLRVTYTLYITLLQIFYIDFKNIERADKMEFGQLHFVTSLILQTAMWDTASFIKKYAILISPVYIHHCLNWLVCLICIVNTEQIHRIFFKTIQIFHRTAEEFISAVIK